MENKTDVKCVIFEMAFDEFPDDLMKDLFGDDFPGWGYDHAGIYATSTRLCIFSRRSFSLKKLSMTDRRRWYGMMCSRYLKPFTAKAAASGKPSMLLLKWGKRVWEAQLERLNQAIQKELPKQEK